MSINVISITNALGRANQKRKDANRARDLARKAIAASKVSKNRISPGKRKRTAIDENEDESSGDQGDEALALHLRMERAMQDADEEQDGDDEDAGAIHAGLSGTDAGDPSEGDSSDEEEVQGTESEGNSRGTNEEPVAAKKPRGPRRPSLQLKPSTNARPSYLPDSIFEAAAKAVASAPARLPNGPRPKLEKRKRRKTPRSTKDIVLGYV